MAAGSYKALLAVLKTADHTNHTEEHLGANGSPGGGLKWGGVGW